MGPHKTHKSWHGIRQAVFTAQADPDAAPVPVKIPAAWGPAAADALAAMLPGAKKLDIALATESWVAPIAARAATAGLLRDARRRAARAAGRPPRRAGCGDLGEQGAGGARFTLNPNGFLDHSGGFDAAGFAAAAPLAVTALTLAAPARMPWRSALPT